ncbi:response regulator [Reyranella sp.]|uniref:response regulator n=1 Tax=Reyranella sp. TaxID=1929291 RepID=UPI003BADA838
MKPSLILNVDDNESGRYIKTRVLRQGGYEVIEARTGVEALETARQAEPDLVLLDVKLPDVSGFEVCRLIKEHTPKLLVLQISASFVAPGDRATGLDSGADAYLSQPVEPSELLATVRALLRLKKAEQAARESNELYRVIVQSAVDYAIVTLDLDGRVRTWSAGAQRVLGWSEEEMAGQPIDRLFTAEDAAAGVPATDRTVAARDSGANTNRWQVAKDGSRLWASASLVPLRGDRNEVGGFIYVLRDRTTEKSEQDAMQRANSWLESEVAARTGALLETNALLRREIEERERAEQALRQAQKMEAVGLLTGGIAHDFNNMLTVVLGATEALKAALPGELKAQHRRADLVMQAATQASALTHRLLAFSRPQPADPKPSNLNALIGGLVDMLRRTIGESITLETELTPNLPLVQVDANQLENAVLNLVVNARDAMSSGGALTLRTAIDGDGWITLGVLDTGSGMPPHVVERAFEPFFTTKRLGEGTGLGLSQVYGFMKQAGGSLRIDSTEGLGTLVELRFPRLEGRLAETASGHDAAAAGFNGAGRRALVVEDQPGVREHAVETLSQLGFEVMAAGDAAAALALLAGDPGIDLLMTDIGLPGGTDGWALAATARERMRGVKIVLMTGYAQSNLEPLGPDSELLMKPFIRSALEARLSRLFGG